MEPFAIAQHIGSRVMAVEREAADDTDSSGSDLESDDEEDEEIVNGKKENAGAA